MAKTMQSEAPSPARAPVEAGRRDPGQPGLELDLPAGLDLPEGLHRQPPEPVLRDHEQRCCTTCTR